MAALISPCLAGHSSLASGTPLGLSLEPSRAWVGVARVYLQVADLLLTGDKLAGTYEIRVPIAPFKNDSGTIELPSPISLERLRRTGGTLVGHALSQFGVRRDITCNIRPDGTVRISVAMDDRTIDFDTRIRPEAADDDTPR